MLKYIFISVSIEAPNALIDFVLESTTSINLVSTHFKLTSIFIWIFHKIGLDLGYLFLQNLGIRFDSDCILNKKSQTHNYIVYSI